MIRVFLKKKKRPSGKKEKDSKTKYDKETTFRTLPFFSFFCQSKPIIEGGREREMRPKVEGRKPKAEGLVGPKAPGAFAPAGRRKNFLFLN